MLFNNGLGGVADWSCRVTATGFFAPDGQILRSARFATCNAETAKKQNDAEDSAPLICVIRKLNQY
jgi:hypothetical protein